MSLAGVYKRPWYRTIFAHVVDVTFSDSAKGASPHSAIFQEKIGIKYCPGCGKKLGRDFNSWVPVERVNSKKVCLVCFQ